MTWIIKRTDTFLESFIRIKANIEPGKKLARKQDPPHTGGWLSGALHGKKQPGYQDVIVSFSCLMRYGYQVAGSPTAKG